MGAKTHHIFVGLDTCHTVTFLKTWNCSLSLASGFAVASPMLGNVLLLILLIYKVYTPILNMNSFLIIEVKHFLYFCFPPDFNFFANFPLLTYLLEF